MENSFFETIINKAKEITIDIPVCAMIVKNNEIISITTNKREENNSTIAHAEILAIQEANNKLNSWRLDGCDMYVTLEPCPMCAWAIINARIKNLYFGSYDTKYGAFGSAINLKELANSNINIFGGINEVECNKLLDDYFKRLRDEKYETPDFIKSDPIQFPHKFKDKKDIEISAFISSLFAFGKREMFLKKLDYLFSLCDSPQGLIKDYKKYNLDNFLYRFIKSKDLIELLRILNKLYYIDKSSLSELFYEKAQRLKRVTNYFYKNCTCSDSLGFCFMFAQPQKGGAMKRLNMFLRWMVRDGLVDFGIWDFIKKEELLIPLDTHVARLSREFGLLKRKQNDFKAVLELTDKLKEFDPNDPIKYDFALFGLGVDKTSL